MPYNISYYRSLLDPFYDNPGGLGNSPFLWPYFNIHGLAYGTRASSWFIAQPPTRWFSFNCTLDTDECYWYMQFQTGNPSQFPDNTALFVSITKNIVLKEIYIETKITPPAANPVCHQIEVINYASFNWQNFKTTDFLAQIGSPGGPKNMIFPNTVPWSGTYYTQPPYPMYVWFAGSFTDQEPANFIYPGKFNSNLRWPKVAAMKFGDFFKP